MVETDRPARILLVEDNPGDVILVRRSMADSGVEHELDVVEDGAEALAYLRREAPYQDVTRPDLVLLDLNLPRVDGHQVLATVKADPELVAIPVVVLTSSSADADVRRAYELHANAYLVKGFGLASLAESVRCVTEFWLRHVMLPAAVDG